MFVVDWNYPNFKKSEFDCSHTGKNEMQKDFLDRLQILRTEYGKPMRVTSGYRDNTHPLESRKDIPGLHAQGLACDIACWSDSAYDIIKLALKFGFTHIGVSQANGKARFVHLGILPEGGVPRIYSY